MHEVHRMNTQGDSLSIYIPSLKLWSRFW